MSVARVREVNARLRAAGFMVHEWPGWESRGNGQSSAYEGGIVHHTASAFGVALPGTGIGNLLAYGRSDLAGPLCNHSCNQDGSFTCFAAHPANHAGASGGRSMGPLPVTSLFNKRIMGLEIVYPGTVPMLTAQYRSALAWSRIVTQVCGFGDIQRARAHAETSITGKWDPGDSPGRTINMVAFRAAALTATEDDMAGEGPNILAAVMTGGASTRGIKLGPDGKLVYPTGVDPTSVLGRTADMQYAMTKALPILVAAAARAGDPLDIDTARVLISAAVRDAVDAAMPEALPADIDPADVEALAEAVKQKLAEALAGGQ